MKREDCFNFVREKVIAKCGEFETVEDQVKYLRFVLKEKKNNPPEIDENVGLKPSFEEFMQWEIEEKVTKKHDEEKEKANNEIINDDSVIKIISKSGVSDIVRIFEAMYDANLIAMNTEVTQIAKIFFTEPLKLKNFADQYYARKDDIENFERNSNSKELVKFVKILIEKSFNKKELILNELTRHIEQVRKT